MLKYVRLFYENFKFRVNYTDFFMRFIFITLDIPSF